MDIALHPDFGTNQLYILASVKEDQEIAEPVAKTSLLQMAWKMQTIFIANSKNKDSETLWIQAFIFLQDKNFNNYIG